MAPGQALSIQTMTAVDSPESSWSSQVDSPQQPSDFSDTEMTALTEKIHAERAALRNVHSRLLRAHKVHEPSIQVVDHLLRTLAAYCNIQMQFEPVGLKFYVEEILAYLSALVARCPSQHELFMDLSGPEVVLALLAKLPWEDSDLVMSIIQRLLLAGGRSLEELPTHALVSGLMTIVQGYLHYEQLRGQCAEQGVVFPAPQPTTLALPLDITWHTLQYAPAHVFDGFVTAAEAAGLPQMMARLAVLPQVTPGMAERVRQIEYMFASVRGVRGKLQGAVAAVVGALYGNPTA